MRGGARLTVRRLSTCAVYTACSVRRLPSKGLHLLGRRDFCCEYNTCCALVREGSRLTVRQFLFCRVYLYTPWSLTVRRFLFSRVLPPPPSFCSPPSSFKRPTTNNRNRPDRVKNTSTKLISCHYLFSHIHDVAFIHPPSPPPTPPPSPHPARSPRPSTVRIASPYICD